MKLLYCARCDTPLILLLVQCVKRVVKTLDKCAVSRVESNDHIALNAVDGVLLHTGFKFQFCHFFPP